jgi:single-strand DNA-binding protein
MNRVFLFGHLGADPELRMLNGGNAVLKMRLATSERRKKGDEWVDHAEWHNVTVWGKRAEGLAKFLVKGSPIIVEGSLRTSSYEDRDGNKRYKTEINANEVRAVGGKRDGQGGGGGRARASESSDAGYGDFPEMSDDGDIPF